MAIRSYETEQGTRYFAGDSCPTATCLEAILARCNSHRHFLTHSLSHPSSTLTHTSCTLLFSPSSHARSSSCATKNNSHEHTYAFSYTEAIRASERSSRKIWLLPRTAISTLHCISPILRRITDPSSLGFNLISGHALKLYVSSRGTEAVLLFGCHRTGCIFYVSMHAIISDSLLSLCRLLGLRVFMRKDSVGILHLRMIVR